jgi:hypothetical protein
MHNYCIVIREIWVLFGTNALLLKIHAQFDTLCHANLTKSVESLKAHKARKKITVSKQTRNGYTTTGSKPAGLPLPSATRPIHAQAF